MLSRGTTSPALVMTIAFIRPFTEGGRYPLSTVARHVLRHVARISDCYVVSIANDERSCAGRGFMIRNGSCGLNSVRYPNFVLDDLTVISPNGLRTVRRPQQAIMLIGASACRPCRQWAQLVAKLFIWRGGGPLSVVEHEKPGRRLRR